MTRHSVLHKNENMEKDIDKNISKKMSDKYSQKTFNHSEQSTIEFSKTVSKNKKTKKAIQKTAEALI